MGTEGEYNSQVLDLNDFRVAKEGAEIRSQGTEVTQSRFDGESTSRPIDSSSLTPKSLRQRKIGETSKALPVRGGVGGWAVDRSRRR